MRPPICCVCGKDMDSPNDGGLIYFKKRKSDVKWDKKMKRIHGVGHPPYAEWFCQEHYDIAIKFKDLHIDRALKKIRE